MKTIEEIEQAIRDELRSQFDISDCTGKIGTDLNLDAVDIVDLVIGLEGNFDCPEIGISELAIGKMTVHEFAVAIHGFLEAQEG